MVVCKPISVFSLGFDQSEQKEKIELSAPIPHGMMQFQLLYDFNVYTQYQPRRPLVPLCRMFSVVSLIFAFLGAF